MSGIQDNLEGRCKYHILPIDRAGHEFHDNSLKNKRIVVVAYLYYLDQVSKLCTYLNNLPVYIEIVIISSDAQVIDEARRIIRHDIRSSFIEKPNIGRDVSALLVSAKPYIISADYVCFVHDKKEHQNIKRVNETELWLENIWENTLVSSAYVEGLLQLFEGCKSIGVLTVPQPIGMHFDTWAGQGWYESFDATRELAERLHLNVEINKNDPPITIGTALWFRGKAMKKLLSYEWVFSDFDDDRLCDGNYISYAVERIFSYIAADAGYETAVVMTDKYAEKQTQYAQNLMRIYADTLSTLLGISLGADCVQVLNRFDNIRDLLSKCSKCYLYGAGRWGRICLRLIRLMGYSVERFIVTRKDDENTIEGVPVGELEDIESMKEGALIVVTVSDCNARDVIAKGLIEKGFHYTCFWE